MPSRDTTSNPNWEALFEVARAQEGLFTTRQAGAAGYSSPLLAHHVNAGRMIRVMRGVYRLVHFPAGEHEGLTALWLWSEQQCVFSHQTALALHALSDALPAKVYVTLPASWKGRRVSIPDDVIPHYADVPDSDRAWFGPVPATSPARTLNDCAKTGLPPDQLRQATLEALHRGLVERSSIPEVLESLEPWGGLEL